MQKNRIEVAGHLAAKPDSPVSRFRNTGGKRAIRRELLV